MAEELFSRRARHVEFLEACGERGSRLRYSPPLRDADRRRRRDIRRRTGTMLNNAMPSFPRIACCFLFRGRDLASSSTNPCP
jgi:hypothetical protein